MNSNRTSYTQTLKLRWSLLLLAALVVFVLLANARQTRPSARPPTAASPAPATVTPAAVTPAAVALAAPADVVQPAAPPAAPPATPPAARPEDTQAPPADSLAPLEHSVAFVSAALDAPPADAAERETIIVSRGDTLSGILARFEVHSALGDLLGMKKQIAPLLNLKPGNPMHLVIERGKLVSLVYERSPAEHFEITRDGGQYAVADRLLPLEKHEAHAFGTIKNSFYRAGLEAGLSDRIIIKIADVLGWDLDFVTDVRAGDRFSVVYEEQYLNGNKLRDGNVLALEFVNNGKIYRAARYTDAAGKSDYFTPGGKSMRKPFLRNPIEYARVSSHFNPRRLHPIFKTVRPHRGVDYAAPTGTPVRASGDGKIKFRGKKSGYGNVVIVQHGRTYSTLYAHLSKFAAGQRRNSQVRQKQVIGYVGATGYATGPHLHYEFRVNGAHKNPLTVKLPDSRPLPRSKIAHFRQAVSPVLAKLDTLSRAYAALSRPQ